MEVAEWLGVCVGGNLAQEGDVRIDAGDERLLQRHPGGLLAGLILAVPVRQGPVEGETRTACRLQEKRNVGWGRPEGKDMSEQRHGVIIDPCDHFKGKSMVEAGLSG